MAYSSAEARAELLDGLGRAVEEIDYALSSLGEAYEQLDRYTAEALETELFGPVQAAYGRAKRTRSSFAARHGLAASETEQQAPGLPSTGAKGFVENAVEGTTAADGALAAVQDSEKFVEVGDAELRADVAKVRELLEPVPARARALLRRLGR